MDKVLYATLYYPSLYEVNEMSQKYEVTLGNLHSDTVEELENGGVTVRTGEGKKEDFESFIVARSKFPIKVLDAAGNPWNPDVRIGNGTYAKVSIHTYDYNYKGKKGVGIGLNALMVLELQEYTPNRMALDPEPQYFNTGVLESSDNLERELM
jgi:hypothetical protein